jgi:hypothetical protein
VGTRADFVATRSYEFGNETIDTALFEQLAEGMLSDRIGPSTFLNLTIDLDGTLTVTTANESRLHADASRPDLMLICVLFPFIFLHFWGKKSLSAIEAALSSLCIDLESGSTTTTTTTIATTTTTTTTTVSTAPGTAPTTTSTTGTLAPPGNSTLLCPIVSGSVSLGLLDPNATASASYASAAKTANVSLIVLCVFGGLIGAVALGLMCRWFLRRRLAVTSSPTHRAPGKSSSSSSSAAAATVVYHPDSRLREADPALVAAATHRIKIITLLLIVLPFALALRSLAQCIIDIHGFVDDPDDLTQVYGIEKKEKKTPSFSILRALAACLPAPRCSNFFFLLSLVCPFFFLSPFLFRLEMFGHFEQEPMRTLYPDEVELRFLSDSELVIVPGDWVAVAEASADVAYKPSMAPVVDSAYATGDIFELVDSGSGDP